MPAAKGKVVTDAESGVQITIPDHPMPPAFHKALKTAENRKQKGFKYLPPETIEGRAGRRAHGFKLGKGGNPSGLSVMGRAYYEARNLAKMAAPDMMKRLIDLAMESPDDRVASVSAVAVLERAGVKPMEYDPAADNPKPTWDPGSLDPQEREQLKALLTKMVKA